MILNLIKNFLLNIVFPKRCLECGAGGDFVCLDCLSKINFLQSQSCPSCKYPNPTGIFCNQDCRNNLDFDQLIVCCEYNEFSLIRKLIMAFKYRFIKDLGGILAEVLKTQLIYISQINYLVSQSVFVPVPIHKKMLFDRGFNQAQVLTEKLINSLKNDFDFSGKFENIFIADCLVRHKYSEKQSTLSRNERFSNLAGSIKFDQMFADKIKGQICILIDDVATTCTTINECGKILKQNGAKYVYALVLARGI